MVGKVRRHVVSVSAATYAEIQRLKAELERTSGRRLTVTDVLDRALENLSDAHERGAWLSPKEMWPVLRERQHRAIRSVIGQVVERFAPGYTLKAVGFSETDGSCVVHAEKVDGDGELSGVFAVADLAHAD